MKDRSDWHRVEVPGWARPPFVIVRGERRCACPVRVVVRGDRCAVVVEKKSGGRELVELDGVDPRELATRDERAAYAVREVYFVLCGSYADDCEPDPSFGHHDMQLVPFRTLDQLTRR